MIGRLHPSGLLGMTAGIALAALAWVPDALAWKQTLTSSGQPVHWSSPCHTYYVNEEGSHQVVDGSDLDAVKASFQAWTDVEGSALTYQFAGETNFATTAYADEQSPINLVIFRDKKWPYTQRPVAFTAVTYNRDDGLILDADIELNEQDYAFTTQPDKEHWKIDLQNTLTHEIGHVGGLDHSNVESSTMFFHAAPGESSKRSLDQDDVDGICALYPAEGAQTCSVVKPQYLFVDFPNGQEPGGCSVAATAALLRGTGLSTAALLLGSLTLLALLARRTRLRPRASVSFRTALPFLLVLPLLLAPTQAAAWNYYLSALGNPVHWDPCIEEIPFWVDAGEIDEIESDGEHQAVAEAFAAWGEPACSPIKLVVAGYEPDPVVELVEGETHNVVAFIHSGWSIDPVKQTYIALTTLSYNPKTGEIVDADLAFNLENFDFSLCGEGEEESAAQDFRYVVLHETGHVFGLNHSNDPLAIMFVQDSTCLDDPGNHLTSDDEEGVCFYYGDPANRALCDSDADGAPETSVAEQDGSPGDIAGSDTEAVEGTGKPTPDCGCTVHAETTSRSAAAPVVVLAATLLLWVLRRKVPLVRR